MPFSFLEKLKKKHAATVESDAEAYIRLVVDIGQEKTIDETAAEELLQRLGKTPERLEADVQAFLQRQVLREKIAEADAQLKEHLDAERESVDLTEKRNEELKAVRHKYDARIQAATAKAAAVSSYRQQLNSLRGQLGQSTTLNDRLAEEALLSS